MRYYSKIKKAKKVKTSEITFGRVIAVCGKPKKMQKINRKLSSYAQNGIVKIQDVTSMYKNAPSSGELAQAAQRGELVDIYITGDDVRKVKEKQQGWNNIREILRNIQDSFNVNQMFISEAVEKILSK